MRRIAGVELTVLLALLIVIAGTGGFATLADEVFAGRVRSFDEWGLRCLRQADNPAALIGPQWVTEAVRGVTSLGGVSFLACASLTVSAGFAVRRRFAAMAFILVTIEETA